jgi:hypothetical protein
MAIKPESPNLLRSARRHYLFNLLRVGLLTRGFRMFNPSPSSPSQASSAQWLMRMTSHSQWRDRTGFYRFPFYALAGTRSANNLSDGLQSHHQPVKLALLKYKHATRAHY